MWSSGLGWVAGVPAQIQFFWKGQVFAWQGEASNDTKCEDKVIRRRCGDNVKMGKRGFSPVLPTSLLSQWLALGSWCMSFYPPQRGPAPRERRCARPELASKIDWRGKYWQSRLIVLQIKTSDSRIQEQKENHMKGSVFIISSPGWSDQVSWNCCESGKCHPPSAVFGHFPFWPFEYLQFPSFRLSARAKNPNHQTRFRRINVTTWFAGVATDQKYPIYIGAKNEHASVTGEAVYFL